MSLESARKYGYIASIINVVLPVVAVVLFVFLLIFQFGSRYTTFLGPVIVLPTVIALAAVSLVGFILFMLSMYRLSKYYNEPAIFKNVLYAFILNVVFSVVTWIVIFAYTTFIMSQISQGNFTTTATATPNPAAAFISFMFVFLLFIIIAVIFAIISAVLYWRAFNKLAEKSGVESFKTVSLLYLIGSVLCIIGVGIILVWIAWIYAAQAYKQLKPQPTPVPTTLYTTPPTATGRIYCSYCGAQNEVDAIYCKNCGKPLTTSRASV